jgi:LPS export ABC transporter protein LptC
VRDLSVEASQATIDLEGRIARLDQVRISLAGGETGPLEVRAPSGEFDMARDVLWLRGGVEGQTRPGERFSTAELSFDQESGRLQSAHPVRIERANMELTASAMDLELAARRLSLHGAVRAELRSE